MKQHREQNVTTDLILKWYNFRTKEYEERNIDNPPKDYESYIPQFPEMIATYHMYIESGSSPLMACAKVLLENTADYLGV